MMVEKKKKKTEKEENFLIVLLFQMSTFLMKALMGINCYAPLMHFPFAARFYFGHV